MPQPRQEDLCGPGQLIGYRTMWQVRASRVTVAPTHHQSGQTNRITNTRHHKQEPFSMSAR